MEFREELAGEMKEMIIKTRAFVRTMIKEREFEIYSEMSEEKDD